MPKIKRFFQKSKNPYKELSKIRKKKNKTKYEKLVLEHRELITKISNKLIAQSKQEISDTECIENIRKVLCQDKFMWLFERGLW